MLREVLPVIEMEFRRVDIVGFDYLSRHARTYIQPVDEPKQKFGVKFAHEGLHLGLVVVDAALIVAHAPIVGGKILKSGIVVQSIAVLGEEIGAFHTHHHHSHHRCGGV